MRAFELCASVLHLPVHVQSGSAATRVCQRSRRDVQGVRLRSHDADVLVYDISLSACCGNFRASVALSRWVPIDERPQTLLQALI